MFNDIINLLYFRQILQIHKRYDDGIDINA